MARDLRKREHIQSGVDVTAGAAKATAESTAKGGVEVAETVSHFQYAPTVVALFPVFASFFFGSHSEHWTDLMLLGLVAIYLHHCVSVPWDYYKISRRRYKTSNKEQMTDKQLEVSKQLRIAELQAFFGLVIGPLLGALLLHYIRGVMARPANGLITNFNVSVFVLAAELRPLRIAYTYLNQKSSTLQQELTDVPPAQYEELADKFRTVEAELKQIKHTVDSEGSFRSAAESDSTSNSSSIQGQTDIAQIKQALRRFERYETQIQREYDEKIINLERKVADLINRPGVVGKDSGISHVAGSIALLPFKALWTFVTVPARLVGYTHTVLHRKRIL